MRERLPAAERGAAPGGEARGRRRVRGALSIPGVRAMIAIVAVAIVAPWIATDAPWISRIDAEVRFPVVGESAAPRFGPAPAFGDPVVRAPLPHRPDTIDLGAVLEPPSGRHWLGTDTLGRDVAARIVHGTRVSVGIGLLAGAVALLIGVPVGAAAGYARGALDAVAMRVIEAVTCFPGLLLLIGILSVSPAFVRSIDPGIRVALAVGALEWVPVARYLRAEFLRLAGSDIAVAARASGAGHTRIVVRHLLPAALPPVLVTAAFAVAGAVALEATLSFLGLGVADRTPSWGRMLHEARSHVAVAWWLALFPGAALFGTLWTLNRIAEGVRKALAPREP